MSPSLQTMGFFMSDINFCNTKEQLNHLGEVVTGKVDGSPTGADIDTSTLPYTGQVRKTLPALENEYEQSITNKEIEADAAIDSYRLLNKGPYASGITLDSKFEYITYNGEAYFAANPPYTTTATTPDADSNLFLGGYTTFENVANKIGNKNELSNSNFLTPSPDAITHPNATPETYVAGTQIFSGVYAGDSGCTVTLIDGRVNCTAGDYQFKLPNTGGLERVPAFASSVSDYDGIPKTTGVSHALVSGEYVVTVTPAAGDVFSVKFEQGSVATRHEVAYFDQIQQWKDEGDVRGWGATNIGDSWTAIQSAIDAGVELSFNEPLYLVSAPLTGATKSMTSSCGTIIRYIGTSDDALFNHILSFDTVDDVVLDGITFDGQVSSVSGIPNQDPAVWDGSNYDTWYGSAGVVFNKCQRVKVVNCGFINMGTGAIRFTSCKDVTVNCCGVRRCRGEFGDGIYLAYISGFTVSNTSVSDITRIGIVGDGGNSKGIVNACRVTYAHDYSQQYGGTEFNAGVWLERTADSVISNCSTSDTSWYGIACVPVDNLWNEYDGNITLPYLNTISNCFVENAKYGIISRLDANDAELIISSCNVKVNGDDDQFGILLNNASGTHTTVNNCEVVILTDTPSACIATSALDNVNQAPIYRIVNCKLGHQSGVASASRLSIIDNVGARPVGEIAQWDQNRFNHTLEVTGCTASSPDGNLTMYKNFKSTPNASQFQGVSIRDTENVYFQDLTYDPNSTFISADSTFRKFHCYSSNLKVSNCNFSGSDVARIYMLNSYREVNNTLRGCEFRNGANVLFDKDTEISGQNGTVAVNFESCVFSKDLSQDSSSCLFLQRHSVASKKYNYIINNCKFLNTNPTGLNGLNSGALNEYTDDEFNDTAGSLNYFDSNITNVVVRNQGFGTPILYTDPTSVGPKNYGERMVLL